MCWWQQWDWKLKFNEWLKIYGATCKISVIFWGGPDDKHCGEKMKALYLVEVVLLSMPIECAVLYPLVMTTMGSIYIAFVLGTGQLVNFLSTCLGVVGAPYILQKKNLEMKIGCI